MSHYDILIVGAGHAGAHAAAVLRQRGVQGSLALLGEENDPPYERPPLSKEYLAGTKLFERMLIKPASFWADRDITLLPGRRVVSVDADRHRVVCADGDVIEYGRLIWATGGHARRLSCSGHDLRGVHTVRTRADVDRMIAELPGVERVVVVGGGYIGLEAAAALTKLGKQVTILEAQDRVLARVAGEPLSRFFEAEHRAHGVDIRLGVQVDCIIGSAGRAAGVMLTNGTVIQADMVIVGVGIIPSVEPLLSAGAGGGNGVVVDDYGRTTLTDVWAIGDCALHTNAFAGGVMVRLESVQNANDMASAVATTIAGKPEKYNALPWFWSNQYDLKLQTVGLSPGYDNLALRGSVKARSFSLIYMKLGRVIALDCVNAVRDYVQGKKLILSNNGFIVERLIDASVPLSDLLTPGVGDKL